MAYLKQLTDTMCVAPQIQPEEIAALKDAGFCLVINNRPDDEEPGQPTSKDIREAVEQAGIAYAHIPVGHGISPAEVNAMREALAGCDGKVLGFCRSGTRSTMLWALAQSEEGVPKETLHEVAEGAGYNLAPISHLL